MRASDFFTLISDACCRASDKIGGGRAKRKGGKREEQREKGREKINFPKYT